MELTNKNITDYIDRFMEGETTNEEEQAIYRYFRSADVPKHLEAYKPMFAWYEQGMPDKSSNRHRADSDLPKKRFPFRGGRQVSRLSWCWPSDWELLPPPARKKRGPATKEVMWR